MTTHTRTAAPQNKVSPDVARANSPSRKKRVALVTMGVKLANEERGLPRFRFIADLLAADGFEVDLITSTFQHWYKEHRDIENHVYRDHAFNVKFIEEPGYAKNLDLARITSHRSAGKNLRKYFASLSESYDLLYVQIPPNNIARICAEYARDSHVPLVVDVNDLWPEAMRMVIDIPILSDIAFHSFKRDAEFVYQSLTAVVGTSDEYAARPSFDRKEPYQHITVYVGNDLRVFDRGVEAHSSEIDKPADELWVSYAGTLGASYDLDTLIKAASVLAHASFEDKKLPSIRFKILGDGPTREYLEALARKLDAPVDFLGYMDYEPMSAYLHASDIVVNSLVKNSPHSIVSKVGDYLASGNPIINTGSSPEMKNKVTSGGFGINVEAEDTGQLVDAIAALAEDEELRATMGKKGRAIAEEEFDQPHSYQRIVELVRSLTSS